MTNRDRRGVALIEVLWGSCVVALLIALQLPAIFRSREAARRSQCVNNLKMIGLALHNYHSVNDTFPMSQVLGSGHGNGHAVLTILLPYEEQSPLYNTYNFHLENWHRANSTTMRVKVASYLCPSNPDAEPTEAAKIRTHRGETMPGTSTFAASHYGANWGGVRSASGEEAVRAYPGSHLGVIMTVVDPDAATPTTTIGFRKITDGTSNTLAMVEKRSSYGWGVGGWGGSEFDVAPKPNFDGVDPKLRRAFTGSFHPDGVNALMCDGAVRFLKSDLNPKTWRALTTRAGAEQVKFE